jgi:hypothetical protein
MASSAGGLAPLLASCRNLALRFSTQFLHAASEQTRDRILRGGADANIHFSGIVQLLKRLGFQERIKGSHHIFFRDGVAEILNLQPYSGKCKPYRQRSIRRTFQCLLGVGETIKQRIRLEERNAALLGAALGVLRIVWYYVECNFIMGCSALSLDTPAGPWGYILICCH